ncbi:hypothetical protein SAMN05428953_12674 [Mesorhizobium muleiense]|uniref:Uncharacterized protein n=1 Tax=Mesorhizobium muleiense TaxID=1004279 RepID=A0A1G9H6Z2_9HYPH|nr:hypothetical protein [Mesorhizobium muleiense]SDL08153.1 hypothetical protein SAMN05428953_12674 [Mesorhizobium muleiense]
MTEKEIPADVVEAATDVARRWYHEEWEPTEYIQQKLVEGIALAILAERKRISAQLFNRDCFLTSVVGDGDPYLKFQFKTNMEMRDFQTAMEQLSKVSRP